MKAQWDEVGERILLGDNTGVCTEAEQVPVCWCLDLKWSSLYVRTSLTICPIFIIFFSLTNNVVYAILSILKDALIRATEFYTVALSIFTIVITAFHPKHRKKKLYHFICSKQEEPAIGEVHNSLQNYRSSIRETRNVVMEKDKKGQLDWSCEKKVSHRVQKERYILRKILLKEGQVDWSKLAYELLSKTRS
jgi:hypothetical protein